MDETKNFSSLGYLSQQLQLPTSTILDWIDTLGAKPAIVLNGVRYFDDATYGVLLLKKQLEANRA
jgi:hypothetical protein